jgi:ubiquinone/menaquinone biosynthesis C-methylase UbiE
MINRLMGSEARMTSATPAGSEVLSATDDHRTARSDSSVLKEEVRRFYDAQSTVYETAHHVAYAGGQYFVRRLASDILNHISPGDRVLEIGCGTGVFSRAIGGPAGALVSSDISLGMLKCARAKNPAALLVVADAEQLPFKNGVFDCVAGVNTFSYFQNKARALSEADRVLKSPGRIVVYDMNLLNPLWYLYPIFDKRHRLYFRQLSRSNRFWLRQLVSESGLRLERLDEFFWIPYGSPAWLVSLLRPLDWLLTHLPGWKHFGSRLTLVCEKPAR